MLKDTIITPLTSRFGHEVMIEPTCKEFAVFKAKHPEVGDVVIDEDGEELIVSIGDITHGHFGSYENGLSEIEHQAVIADDLIGFLDDLFADKVLLFKATWGGGWTLIQDVGDKKLHSPRRRWYKWSGPINFSTGSN